MVFISTGSGGIMISAQDKYFVIYYAHDEIQFQKVWVNIYLSFGYRETANSVDKNRIINLVSKINVAYKNLEKEREREYKSEWKGKFH